MRALAGRILLIDPSVAGRSVLAERLRLQGFDVAECGDGAEGAIAALEEPPSAVVADLSMPSISGVQLCRLLRSETGTQKIPIILRGPEGRRNRFWAEQAGATAYVAKGRMGELVRALRRSVIETGSGDFFVSSPTDGLAVRERIATHLDAALFESVIAAEIRRLGTCESFDRLLDMLSQFLSQVTTYRWMALYRRTPACLGLHANPQFQASAVAEARELMGVAANVELVTIQDEDAFPAAEGPRPCLVPITFGETVLGSFALATCPPAHAGDLAFAQTVARELAGAVRVASLVEDSRRVASMDPLTGLLNRRSFLDRLSSEVTGQRASLGQLSVILLDVDHFKCINDEYGHTTGDAVLAEVARALTRAAGDSGVIARWGGEEFLLALQGSSLSGAQFLAERIRAGLQDHPVHDAEGRSVQVTASFGVAERKDNETLAHVIDRADRAMYSAKTSGRNRVHTSQAAERLRRDSAVPAP